MGVSDPSPAVGASPDRAAHKVMSHHNLLGTGRLVRPASSRIGTGKVVSSSADECVVEFFHSASRREVRTFRPTELAPAHLARQTRCYVRDSECERWIAGRIGARDGLMYEVNFPDQRFRWISESEIYVRCSAPCADPTETLVLKSHETAAFHGPRLALVEALINQRAVSRGLTGLTSAKIELFAHQVEVVRRVLEDPVQRYLLADEVGLGKTIEAGVLIRQYLLDEPEGHVVVLVPPLLLDQWRDELDARFEAFHGDRVHVVSTAELDRVPTHLDVGMLVVDEAHHVAASAASRDAAARAAFEVCRHLAHATERVILLSATPAANHEAQFLAMLHLLDPQTYQLEGIEAFRARVRMRQEIGRMLLTVTEEARPFSLKLNLPKLAALFPGDQRLSDLGSEILAMLERDPSDPARPKLIRAIRTHVSETYRLHRRMLRNRRGAIPDAIFDRADQRLVAMRDESEESARLDDALDEWRSLTAIAVRRASEAGDTGRPPEEFNDVFLALVETSDGSPWLLAQAIRWRLHGDAGARRELAGELPAETLRRLREVRFVDGELAALDQLLLAAEEAAAADRRIRALENLLRGLRDRAGRGMPPRCVVFTGFTGTARRIAERLEAVLGRKAVAWHVAGLAHDVVEEGVRRFRESHDCFVLVCDHTAEEGRNFHFADRLIHFDLPWHPNRLEQRIGRVDRINRVRDLTSHVLLGRSADDSLHEAWYRLVGEGLGLFETSIASLQFYVDEQAPRVLELVFRAGAAGLTEHIPAVRAEIEAERERIEEQAAIDEIDARDESAADFFGALDAADAAYEPLREAVEGWMCGTLQFGCQPDGRMSRALRYTALDRTLVPAHVVAARFGPYLSRAGTYDRTVAARHPEVALHRLGDGLIDALDEYVAWDDRGQAFAIWREDQDWDPREGTEWVGFRFDVVAEADTQVARDVLARLAKGRTTPKSLDRRADALFPPRIETVFADVALAEIVDPAMLERLRRPFNKHRGPHGVDHNLTKHRIGAINAVVPEETWERLCREARDAALRLVRARPAFRERCEQHAVQAARKLGLQLEQLRLRESRGTTVRTRELEIEQALCEAIVAGIRTPRLRVDAAGFIVISGRGPLSQPPHAPEATQRG